MFAKKTYRNTRWVERLTRVCDVEPCDDEYEYVYYRFPDNFPVFLLIDSDAGLRPQDPARSVGMWQRVWGFSIHVAVDDEVRFVCCGDYEDPTIRFGNPLRVEGRWVRHTAREDVAW